MLHGSSDGFTGDNQSHTVSIIKVKDSNEVLGGYNLIEWTSKDFYDEDRFGITRGSFILSAGKILIIIF